MGTPFLILNPSLAPQAHAGEEAVGIGGRVSSVRTRELPVHQMSHTQPYSYHTVCWSPPGSGDAGVLFELLPRL